ncbi:MAG: TMEM43 family protein [Candidatus Electrothrix sp. YB6]
MSEDSFTEVTEQSWFSRIGKSITGIFFGLLLFVAAFPLLFWNEGRAVKTYKTLKEGAGAVVSVPADRVDPANAGKLIHITGRAVTEDTLTDPVFGLSANALKLLRRVEMYQWEEESSSTTEKKVGGGTKTVTKYSYSKTWSDRAINSSSFRKSGYDNPGSMPYANAEQIADRVMLGAFTLPTSLVSKIGGAQQLPVSSETPLPDELVGRAQRHDSGIYIGNNPSDPQIGDVRIHFETVPQQEISVVAQQTGSSFTAYQTSAGGTIELLQTGTRTAEAMFQKAQTDNKILTWILRVVGFILMLIGLNLIFKVFSVLADVLPFLGSIVGAGTGIISFLIAGVLSLITIAVAWIVFRPILGAILLAAAVVLIVLIGGRIKAGRAKVATPPPPPPAAA